MNVEADHLYCLCLYHKEIRVYVMIHRFLIFALTWDFVVQITEEKVL